MEGRAVVAPGDDATASTGVPPTDNDTKPLPDIATNEPSNWKEAVPTIESVMRSV